MTRLAALHAPTVLRHARRVLLLLGAAFVWWLVFSGGPAQADTGTSPDDVVATTPDAVVEQATAAATDAVRAAPRQVTDDVDRAVRPAPEPVRTAVQTLTATLEPTLSGTSTALADTVDQAVRQTVETVTPALHAAAAAAETPGAPVRTAATAGAAKHRATHQPRKPRVATSSVRPDGRAPVALDRSGVHAAQQPLDTPGTPAAPDAPAVPASANGGAPTGAAAFLGALLVVPPSLRRRSLRPAGSSRRLDAAYPPGSSPD